MARPTKRRVPGSGGSGAGRTTPKGGSGSTKGGKAKDAAAESGSGRYTAPIPAYQKTSPIWVPVLMFAFWGVGFAVIIGNYLAGDSASNWFLLVGLGLILAGILTATQYR
jgi:hypothetical protein